MPTTLLKSPVIKRSVTVNGRKTAVSIETAFWDELKSIAAERSTSLNKLIAEIDADRQRVHLSSALRLVVLATALHRGEGGPTTEKQRPEERDPPERVSQSYVARPLTPQAGGATQSHQADAARGAGNLQPLSQFEVSAG